MPEIFTIGHSSVDAAAFVALLRQHRIEVVADVRSSPYSAWLPHFNREPLEKELRAAGIKYLFMGDELGARRLERECYTDGRADYDAIAKLPSFRRGLERLKTGAEKYRISLMCAEKDPLECHRTVLVARRVQELGIQVTHILADGSTEPHRSLELRLLQEESVPAQDLFLTREELVNEAYQRRGAKIAWQEESEEPKK